MSSSSTIGSLTAGLQRDIQQKEIEAVLSSSKLLSASSSPRRIQRLSCAAPLSPMRSPRSGDNTPSPARPSSSSSAPPLLPAPLRGISLQETALRRTITEQWAGSVPKMSAVGLDLKDRHEHEVTDARRADDRRTSERVILFFEASSALLQDAIALLEQAEISCRVHVCVLESDAVRAMWLAFQTRKIILREAWQRHLAGVYAETLSRSLAEYESLERLVTYEGLGRREIEEGGTRAFLAALREWRTRPTSVSSRQVTGSSSQSRSSASRRLSSRVECLM